ncbi:glutamine--tRNA ligase/YqeY domain fusion protein, partial [Bacteroidota bacterium]
DIRSGKNQSRVHTRFPPEPNGYLHIGHAKSICLNFGLAKKYNGLCNLRFDDTNPTKEEIEYVNSIQEDIKWLGFEWHEKTLYASDYFNQLYEWAELLIQKGKAYVCELTPDEIAEQKGTPTKAGQESPYRNRPVEENLDLFRRMKAGEFEEGSKVLRAKIDMTSPNMHMRDPIMYRIIKRAHHRTGSKWNIYPMYDYTHGQSDYIEGITHSICTLEFEVHRPLYDWFLDQILDNPKAYRPRQYEFARLNLNYTIMSKRKLLQLVNERIVSGWDDPRMPTISGYRRRGYTPESIRNFSEIVGVTKINSVIDVALLENSIREDLNKNTARRMAVLNPLKVIIKNYPDDLTEELEATNNPEKPEEGKRKVPFSKELYIERTDFMEDPPKKFFRLGPGREVRLKYAYIIRCDEVIKDDNGEIIELHCTYDPETKSGTGQIQRKVKGTLHWVSIKHAINAEVRLYDRLFTVENPDADKEKIFLDFLNPKSLEILTNCYLEPSLATANVLDKFQFERIGYFCVDKDTVKDKLVFNRTVTLRDTWAKIAGK